MRIKNAFASLEPVIHTLSSFLLKKKHFNNHPARKISEKRHVRVQQYTKRIKCSTCRVRAAQTKHEREPKGVCLINAAAVEKKINNLGRALMHCRNQE